MWNEFGIAIVLLGFLAFGAVCVFRPEIIQSVYARRTRWLGDEKFFTSRKYRTSLQIVGVVVMLFTAVMALTIGNSLYR